MNKEAKGVYIELYARLSEKIFHSFGTKECEKLKNQRNQVKAVIKESGGWE